MRRIQARHVLAMLLVCGLAAPLLAQAPPAPAQPKPDAAKPEFRMPPRPPSNKIYMVATPRDHGRANRHEHVKDLTALKECLENASNVGEIDATLVVGQTPGANLLGRAAVVVMESSGDRIPGEKHAIFPQNADTDSKTYDPSTMERLKWLNDLIQKGVGVVAIHYTNWINNETGRKYWLDWVGGVADYGQDDSKVMVADWNIKPINTEHPILRGITPWSEREEFLTQELLPPDPRRTPLVEATKAEGGDSYVVGWAVEREGGGRGFVFTGSDFHANMSVEQQRRLLANAILWAGKMEVPEGGVACPAPQSAVDAANAR